MTNPKPEKPQGQQTPQSPRQGRSIFLYIAILALGVLFITFLRQSYDKRIEISASQFWKYLRDGQMEGMIKIHDKEITGTLRSSARLPGDQDADVRDFFVAYEYRVQEGFEEKLTSTIEESTVLDQPWKYETTGWFEGILPHLLFYVALLLAVWFLLFRRIGSAAGSGGFLGGFGRSRHRVMTKEHTQVTFEDVAGISEAKDEVRELIEFLKNPKRFTRIGGRVPRGVLLVGEPGCGKTLLAKAIAGEADVPFFSISGSDFVEMFVGVGASRVRDLFKQAKESSPCIIFLDEIDAVGRRRGMGFSGGGHDEREQTLNAILVEMDGFDSSDQVIVIAATNRQDVLDPALTRPGRFDRQIQVPLPDLKGRFEILKIYLDKVHTVDEIDLHRLARGTPMFSGADLEALVNEAAIAATMAGKEAIEQEDLEEARDKVRWGRARKSRVIDEHEKNITAYHEAGHALVQASLEDADPLHKVSIIPRGPFGGATFSLPEKDRYLYSRRWCQAQMKVALAGRIAEDLFCNDVTSGAQNDIAQVTEIAKKMVLDWGMSDQLGMVNYHNDDKRIMPMESGGKEYSEHTAEIVDREIRKLVDEAYTSTREILEDSRDALERLAQALIKYETLDAADVMAIMEGKSLDKPTVGDLLEAEQHRTAGAQGDGSTISPPVPGEPPSPEPGEQT
jgi:cell division protease FtsH